MTRFDRFLLILCVVASLLAQYNAGESHRHTHELACHVQADDLCAFAEKPHD